MSEAAIQLESGWTPRCAASIAWRSMRLDSDSEQEQVTALAVKVGTKPPPNPRWISRP